MSDLTAEVRDALAAATPGPWEQSRGFPAIVYGADRNDIYSRPREEIERNVHLIASAPSWLAALCDRLDAEPVPVKPSRGDVARVIVNHSGHLGTHYMDVALAAADAVLALLPGRTESEVKAEAWDEGYTRGFYDRELLSGDSRDACEGASENPYRGELNV